MADVKRAHSPEANGHGGAIVKRQRVEDVALTKSTKSKPEGPARTSALLAPIMLLTGHAGEVFTCKFNPTGDVIASGSHDKHIFLWRTYGECENYMMMKGVSQQSNSIFSAHCQYPFLAYESLLCRTFRFHQSASEMLEVHWITDGHKNAVLEVQWTTDGERVLSASPDKSVRAWDAATGEQVKKMSEHDNFVNSCCPLRRGPPLLVSGSDDATAKLWDLRAKRSAHTMSEDYQILSVAFGEAGDQIYTGGIENVIKVWDLRKIEVSMTLKGHTDTITGLRVSPDGNLLLSNAMDNTMRVWDMRPYAPQNRCMKVFTGHQHSFERNSLRCDWSPDGSKVTGGSADRMVYVWEMATTRLMYKLPGHNGSVNEAVFHPQEPIIASAGSDKQIYVGELAL